MARTQRQALVCITGALRSTPPKAPEKILGIDTIDIHAQLTAGKFRAYEGGPIST